MACSDQAGPKDEPNGLGKGQGGAAPNEAIAVAPSPPAIQPELPVVSDRDRDGNKLDDVLDAELSGARALPWSAKEQVEVEIVLKTPVTQADLDTYVGEGGRVRYVFKALSYGWIGSIERSKLPGLANRLGAALHLIAGATRVVHFMDEATRTGRIRNIWAPGFAASVSGYSGTSNITVAVIDTGVDGTHTDLSGRMQGWKDYTSDAFSSTRDLDGHGTHVTSIAVGTGAAFGAGTGTLTYTQSGNLTGAGPFGSLSCPIHSPAYFGGTTTLSSTATGQWLGTSTTIFGTQAADGAPFTSLGNKTGASPLSASFTKTPVSARYQTALVQSTASDVTNFAVTTSISSYPGVGDGFNALRGVAAGCKWFGAKVFVEGSSGASSLNIDAALDDLVSRRATDNIKVLNMSLGVSNGGTDTLMRAKVNTAVDNGVLVVVAAGNDGPSTAMGDPGHAAKAITVGASSDMNELTSYTSTGFSSPSASEDNKPDVLAPGGSGLHSMIMAADSNTADGQTTSIPDLSPNDYQNIQGTSMAAPFVSGALGLMIDALQQSGQTWTFSANTQPLFIKMLLLAAATEINGIREGGTNSPTLGRAAAPKDLYEGYGIINPDAAIEAMTETFSSPLTGSASNVAPARLEWEKRSWGRKISVVNGSTVALSLAVPATADYDLYLYSGSPDSKGNPIILASSTNAAVDTDESIACTSLTTQTAYLFVKRVSGYGAFSLSGSVTSHCGNGAVDAGEQCDPSVSGSATCCTSTCAAVGNGTSCTDGNSCTQTDSCQAGVCTGSNSVICTAADQCHDVGTCDATTGKCSNPAKSNGSTCSDGNACTQSDTCQAGICSGANSVVCAASDQCHDAGTCDVTSGKCSNPAKSNGATCSDGNACTQTDTCQAGVCSGANSVVCAASDQCHAVGTCDATSGKCSNPTKSDGTSCNDANACTQTDTCQAGICTGASPTTCTAADQCHDVGTCDVVTGKCSNPAKANGASCNDNNACSGGDACQAGVCTPVTTVTCSAVDQCHDAGVCDAITGKCSTPNKANGSACDDGNPCTQSDTCQAGACMGSNPMTCAAADQCHSAGVCDVTTGKCSNPAKSNGTACTDANACTQTDTCQAGVCTGSNAVVCAASDQCHDVGTCDVTSGKCSNPAKSNGATCTDGNACTQTDTCQAGVCAGSNAVVCAASDQCHAVGTCDTTSGKCSNPAKSNGAACSDGNACTQTDTCQAGVCTGSNSITCSASDQCHDAGTCDGATGKCSNPPKANGSACDDGNACSQSDACQAGVCSAGTMLTCTASDQCHAAGACDPRTGQCSNPAKADGASCDDSNACTQTDSCNGGVCRGGNNVVCAASDQCHVAGVCDAQSGSCTNPAANDGTPCSDADPCTQTDTCQAGACRAGTPVVCVASDQCHDSGVCDPFSGQCSNPPKPSGAACTDGDACTLSDSCQSGTCQGAFNTCGGAAGAGGGTAGGGGAGGGGGSASGGAAGQGGAAGLGGNSPAGGSAGTEAQAGTAGQASGGSASGGSASGGSAGSGAAGDASGGQKATDGGPGDAIGGTGDASGGAPDASGGTEPTVAGSAGTTAATAGASAVNAAASRDKSGCGCIVAGSSQSSSPSSYAWGFALAALLVARRKRRAGEG